MLKKLLVLIAVLITSCIFFDIALAEIRGFEVTADVNYSSIYMWRGIMLDGDPVLQPGVYIKTPESKFGRVKIGYWRSFPLGTKDSLKSKEIDYIFDYTYNFKDFDISVGYTYYDFPDAYPADGDHKGFSREVYVGFALPKLFLSPSVYYYYDYGKKEEGGGQGSYTVLNMAYSKPFSVRKVAMSLDLSGHIGYNNKLYFRGKGGELGITAGINVPLGKHAAIKPNISYALPWGNLSDKYNGNQKQRVYSGVYVSFAY
jgi:hypothetical protein